MTVDCIVFKADGTQVLHQAEINSSHLALTDSKTKQSESYTLTEFTDENSDSHLVYKIAYQVRPSDKDVRDAIGMLKPEPIKNMK